MALQAFDKITGERVHIGDTVIDFRGGSATLEAITRPASDGRSGKVVARGREFYDRVYGLVVRDVP